MQCLSRYRHVSTDVLQSLNDTTETSRVIETQLELFQLVNPYNVDIKSICLDLPILFGKL